MASAISEQVIALSALFAATEAVGKIAHEGKCAPEVLPALLVSLARRDRPQMRDYFGASEVLNRGRQVLLRLFEQDLRSDEMRYALQAMALAPKLLKNAKLMAALRVGLADLDRQLKFFAIDHETIIARVALLYQEAVSPAGRKILITGDVDYLRQETLAQRIRALLLCAVRAATLWRAAGGSSWQLVWARGAILAAAQKPL